MGRRIILLWMLLVLAGCGFQAPHRIVPDYAKGATRLIALMPVDNKTADSVAAKMLREKMLEELYFKGYPKIPLDFITAKLHQLDQGDVGKPASGTSPKTVGGLLAVDALLYCTLNTLNTSRYLLYSSTSLSLACELKSAKTGETLWQARYDTAKRNLGYSRSDLDLKVSQVYEAAIQEAVTKVLETLPDGPDLLGS